MRRGDMAQTDDTIGDDHTPYATRRDHFVTGLILLIAAALAGGFYLWIRFG